MLRRAMPSNTRGAVSLSKSSFRPSQGDCQSSLLSLIFISLYFPNVPSLKKLTVMHKKEKKTFLVNISFYNPHKGTYNTLRSGLAFKNLRNVTRALLSGTA